MKKIIVCIFVLSFSILLLTGCGLSSHSKTYIMEPIPYHQGINLKIASNNGDIEIANGKSEEIQIYAVVKAWAEEKQQARMVTETTAINTTYNKDSNSLKIDYNNSGNLNFDYRIKVDYRILLPETFNAEIITDNGDINIEKMKGNLYAQSQTGDLNIFRLEGNIQAYLSSDDIQINQLQAKNDITLKTDTGKIFIDYLELDSSTDNLIKSSTGDILLNISGNTVIKASTSTGDIIYEGGNYGSFSEFIIGRSSSSWTPRLTLESYTGDIELSRY